MPRVDRSTIWPYDAEGEPREFYYSRYGHPTGAEAEARLGELEGGQALLFASGMAAETAVVLALARPGTTIALARGAYFGTSVLFRSLEDWGLRYVEYDQTGPPPADADIVWVESPANPVLTVPDWDAVRAHDGLVVCDATVATPIYLRALDEGADVVVHSATKFITGIAQCPVRRCGRAGSRTGRRHPRRADADGLGVLAALGGLRHDRPRFPAPPDAPDHGDSDRDRAAAGASTPRWSSSATRATRG